MNLLRHYRTLTPPGVMVCRKCQKPMVGYSRNIEEAYRYHTACNHYNPDAVARAEERERQKQAFFARRSQERAEKRGSV